MLQGSINGFLDRIANRLGRWYLIERLHANVTEAEVPSAVAKSPLLCPQYGLQIVLTVMDKCSGIMYAIRSFYP